MKTFALRQKPLCLMQQRWIAANGTLEIKCLATQSLCHIANIQKVEVCE
jgi:hypothetical protein